MSQRNRSTILLMVGDDLAASAERLIGFGLGWMTITDYFRSQFTTLRSLPDTRFIEY